MGKCDFLGCQDTINVLAERLRVSLKISETCIEWQGIVTRVDDVSRQFDTFHAKVNIRRMMRRRSVGSDDSIAAAKAFYYTI